MEEEKVKIFRFAALNLRKMLTEEKDTARLSWSMRGEYPRITVYTSANNAFKEDHTIDYNFVVIAPFDVVTLMYFIQTLNLVIDNSKSNEFSIDCLNTKVENGVRTNEKIVQATVVIGKDENGVVYLQAYEDGKRKVKFELLPNSQWFKYKNQDGSTITDKAFLSKMYAKGYSEALTRLMFPKYDEYVTEVMIDKPNIVKETKKPQAEVRIEKKPEPAVEPPKEEIKEIKVVESKLQSLTKVPADEKPMDDELEALLNM